MASASVGSPVQGECAATRASPASTTATTPSIVTDDSATLVARTTLRRPAGSHGARLLLERHLAVQRQDRQLGRLRQLGERRLRAPDLAGARKKDQQVAVGLLAQELPDRRRDPPLERPVVARPAPTGRCSIATSNRRPSLRTVVARRRSPARNARTGSASSVADMATTARSGPRPFAQPAQPGERQIGRHVPLVQLVEHDGRDAAELAGRRAGAARTAPRS